MKENYIATLVHHKIETPIRITTDHPVLLVVESPREFFTLVRELRTQFSGGEGDFVLLKGEDRISFEKVAEFVDNIFAMDFGDKKALNLLYKNLEKAATDIEIQKLQYELSTFVAQYYRALFDYYGMELTFDELSVNDILKAGKVRFCEDYSELLEKIVCYINAMVHLKGCKFFVFLHLKSVLEDEELIQLYKHCEAEKVGLVLIESSFTRGKVEGENPIIITDDLCEIVDNFGKID